MGPNGDLGPNVGPNLGQNLVPKEPIWVKMGSKKSLIWGESGVSKPESGTF